MEIHNLPDKDFEETVTRMLNKLESRVEELREHFNKEFEDIIKNQSEMKNTITKMKITSEGIDSRLDNTEWISYPEDKVVEITQSEQQNEKKI